MRRLALWTTALLLAAGPVRAVESPAGERPRVAVLGLQTSGVDATVARTLTGLLGTEVSRLDRYEVLSEEDVKGLVAATALAQVLGCEGAACAANLSQLASQLNAGLLVTGTVGAVGARILLNLTVLDARTGTVRNRATAEAASLEGLPGQLRGAVLALFGIAGRISLWNQLEGAQVFLNEKLVGTAPVKPIDLPQPGRWSVRVFRDDATPFETSVDVAAGEVARVRVESYAFRDLEGWSASRRTWGLGLGGGGLVLAGGATALWLFAARNDAGLAGLDFRRPEDVAQGKELAGQTFGLTVGAVVASLAAGGLLGGGGWLLFDDPWARLLERSASVVPLDGGAQIRLAGRF